jgi:hypothetical protein
MYFETSTRASARNNKVLHMSGEVLTRLIDLKLRTPMAAVEHECRQGLLQLVARVLFGFFFALRLRMLFRCCVLFL